MKQFQIIIIIVESFHLQFQKTCFFSFCFSERNEMTSNNWLLLNYKRLECSMLAEPTLNEIITLKKWSDTESDRTEQSTRLQIVNCRVTKHTNNNHNYNKIFERNRAVLLMLNLYLYRVIVFGKKTLSSCKL